MTAPWFFRGLPRGAFDCLVVDPAWHFVTRTEEGQHKAASRYYDVMARDKIMSMPVRALGKRDCVLFLWATGCMREQAHEALRAWGFAYKIELIWRKVTRNAKPRVGFGYWARSMHEPVLIATAGKPRVYEALPSIFDGIAREHSRKPEEFYKLVDERVPGSKADIFARQSRLGWTCWGEQKGLFDAL